MDVPGRAHAKSWEGQEVLDRTGVAVGRCVGVFADTDTEVVEWLLVDVTEHGRSFVPALDVVDDAGSVRLSFARDRVLSAPSVGDAEQLSQDDEAALYRHYGVPFSDDTSGSLLPEGVDVPEDDGAAAPDAAPQVAAAPHVASSTRRAPSTTSTTPAPPPVAFAPPAQHASPPDRSQSDALAAAAPLAALAAAVAAVWWVLRGLDRRAARRRSLPARTERARRQAAKSGRETATQLSAALAAASTAAERRARRAAELAAQRAKAAEKQREKAVKGARKKRRKTVRAARVRRDRTTKTVASGVTQTAERVVAVPVSVAGGVAGGARRVRRGVTSTLWNVAMAAAAAGGYVLGARAGRERYEEITEVAAAAAATPVVQTAKKAVVDPEHRDEAVQSLKEQLKSVLPG